MDKTKLTEAAREKRNEYARTYYKKWRAENKDKKSEYNTRYWNKKVGTQAE